MKLIEAERKSRLLTRAEFGCLRGAYAINVTRGCEFGCVYCYARGYPEAPAPGEIYLYRNLPERLAAELDNPRRRTPVRGVIFNTASDSFQTHPAVLDVTYQAMRVLMKRRIGFSFLTKGRIPQRFIALFAEHPQLVTARIGMVSTRPRFRKLFEPHAATAAERLQNIANLRAAGVEVEVRVDPIIPFLTDDAQCIRSLFAAVAERGVRRVTLSYLHLRPAIFEQLRHELPGVEFALLRTCFETRPWSVVGASARSKLIPAPLRRKGYARFREIADEFDLIPLVCACKNPDLPAQLCSARDDTPREAGGKGRQLSLFPC
ncbi:MAG: SPL family radical SAM protein [Hyphomicrobiales bacterium]